jgi:hypothetical protein
LDLPDVTARIPELRVVGERLKEHLDALGAVGRVAWGTVVAAGGQPDGGRLVVASDIGIHDARWGPGPNPADDWQLDTVVVPWSQVTPSITSHAESTRPGTVVSWTVRIAPLEIDVTLAGDRDPALVEFAAECARRRASMGL